MAKPAPRIVRTAPPVRIQTRSLDDATIRAAALALLIAAAGSLALIIPLRRGLLR